MIRISTRVASMIKQVFTCLRCVGILFVNHWNYVWCLPERKTEKFTRKVIVKMYLITGQFLYFQFLVKCSKNLHTKLCFSIFFKNEVISPHQAGVEAGNSCINQYFKEVTHEIYKRFNNELQVFLDVFEPVALHKKWSFPLRISSVNTPYPSVSVAIQFCAGY